MPEAESEVILFKWARRSVQVGLSGLTHITVRDKWVTFHYEEEDPIEVRRTLAEVREVLGDGEKLPAEVRLLLQW